MIEIAWSFFKKCQQTVWKESKNASKRKIDLFFGKNLNFQISKKKMNGLEALWIFRTIHDWHFFDEINPIRENWINK